MTSFCIFEMNLSLLCWNILCFETSTFNIYSLDQIRTEIVSSWFDLYSSSHSEMEINIWWYLKNGRFYNITHFNILFVVIGFLLFLIVSYANIFKEKNPNTILLHRSRIKSCISNRPPALTVFISLFPLSKLTIESKVSDLLLGNFYIDFVPYEWVSSREESIVCFIHVQCACSLDVSIYVCVCVCLYTVYIDHPKERGGIPPSGWLSL